MGTEAVWIPLVAAALPAIIGGIGSAIAGSSASSANGAVDAAGAQKLLGMQQAAQATGAYRPQIMEAQQKALALQMAQYKPAENMLQSMYGGGSTPGAPGGGGGYEPPLPPGWFNVNGKPTPGGPDGPLVDPWKQAGFADQAAYERWRAWADEQARLKTATKTNDPGGDPNPGGTPPIITNPNPTSFTGSGLMAAPIGLGEDPPAGPPMGMDSGGMAGGGPMMAGLSGAPAKPTPGQVAPMIKAMLGGG